MNVQQLQRLRTGTGDTGTGLPVPREKSPGNFKETLNDAIGQVDDAQKTSDQQIERFVSGEQENLHEVMLSMEEANLSFELMVEVRNRVLEGYQELMRLQV